MTELFGVDTTVDERSGPAGLKSALLEIELRTKLFSVVCRDGPADPNLWRNDDDPSSNTGTLLIVNDASDLF